MRTLYRKEYATICTEYHIDITPDFIAEIQKEFDEHYTFAGGIRVKITEQDIIDAWNFNETEKLVVNEVISWANHGASYTYERPISLFGILRDMLSDEMWCAQREELDYNTDDYEDYVDQPEEEEIF